MAKFTVEHKSSKKVDHAFQELKTFLEKDPDLRRFDPKMDCVFDEKGKIATIKSSQFKANVEVVEHEKGSQISIHVDLPLLLTPFKGKVQEMLQKKLSKYLA